jgi:hypothetical protein
MAVLFAYILTRGPNSPAPTSESDAEAAETVTS